MALLDEFNFVLISGEGLSGGVRDGVIRTLLSNEAFADYSQRESREIFREAGFSFRDSVFNNIYNDVIGIEKRARRIGSLGFEDTPTDSHFGIPRYPLPKQYRYTVRYDYVDQATGKELTSFITVDKSFRDKIGNVLDYGLDYISEHYNLNEETIIGAQIVRGYRNR